MVHRRNLLWIDGIAGILVGVAMLATSAWLVDWYRLSQGFLVFMGCANLAYGSYSLSLARRKKRRLGLILLLVAANATWACLCAWWVSAFSQTASLLGLGHLAAEGLFVGGLALLEWRWRAQLASGER